MNSLHRTTQMLMADLFDDHEKSKLESFAKLLANAKHGDKFEAIWIYDQTLGGLGGYAMPSYLPLNPFNTWGKDRNLFRSVQYAKGSIIYNPYYPRGVIVDAGRSLEFTCKYILDYHSFISRLSNKEMLGKNLDQLRKKRLISNDLYEKCRLLASLTNVAKHEFTEADSRNSTFTPLDGLVAYFSLRKLHNTLLDTIDHPTRQLQFEIYEDGGEFLDW